MGWHRGGPPGACGYTVSPVEKAGCCSDYIDFLAPDG